VYLPSLRSERVDVLVWVLFEQVLPDVMAEHARTMINMRGRSLTVAERQRIRQVDQLSGSLSKTRVKVNLTFPFFYS
jgi:hypothetical protein